MDAVHGARRHESVDQTSESLESTGTAILSAVLGEDNGACSHAVRLARTWPPILYGDDSEGHLNAVSQYGPDTVQRVKPRGIIGSPLFQLVLRVILVILD